MMLNSSFELGGCCLARYGAASYFASKTDEILSRYRPIAPKPVAQGTGMADIAQPCPSAMVRSTNKSRKRSWDAVVSSPVTRAPKRAASRAARCTVEMSSSSRPSGADTSEEAVSALCEMSDSAASKNYYYPKFGYHPRDISDSPRAKSTSTVVILEKDAAFMERAAASASPSVIPQGCSQGCAVDAEGSCAEDLVTLPLLPNTPYRRDSPSASNSCDSTSCMHSQMEADRRTASLEQLYSASPDPVLLLMDDSHQILWFNPAYKRASAQSSLGTPIPLSTFSLNMNVKSMATLWGFAKKSSGHVIMPQPVRAVGSTVSIECIVDINLQASAVCGSVEEVEQELECESLPSLISDANNRVRWVNSSYKQMVGQPECSWLQTTNAAANSNGNGRVRMNGEVVLVTNNINQKLPQEGSFSGRVKIQWANSGVKTSLTLPSDVTVLRPTSSFTRHVYAWKFDIGAALRLTC